MASYTSCREMFFIGQASRRQRAGVTKHCGQIHSNDGKQHAWNRLVASGNADETVITPGAHDDFDGVGDPCCAPSVWGDEDFKKPQLGVAATWNNVTPCNAGLDVLRQAAAKRLNDTGQVVAYEFDTISVSDGISMGSAGMRTFLVSRDGASMLVDN
jgi:hypothetical protein